MLSNPAALIDYVINRYILICSSEVGFLCRHNAVYSDAILLPTLHVGTKRVLSNAQQGMQQLFCSLCIFFLVLVKKTPINNFKWLLTILNFRAFEYYTLYPVLGNISKTDTPFQIRSPQIRTRWAAHTRIGIVGESLPGRFPHLVAR